MYLKEKLTRFLKFSNSKNLYKPISFKNITRAPYFILCRKLWPPKMLFTYCAHCWEAEGFAKWCRKRVLIWPNFTKRCQRVLEWAMCFMMWSFSYWMRLGTWKARSKPTSWSWAKLQRPSRPSSAAHLLSWTSKRRGSLRQRSIYWSKIMWLSRVVVFRAVDRHSLMSVRIRISILMI